MNFTDKKGAVSFLLINSTAFTTGLNIILITILCTVLAAFIYLYLNQKHRLSKQEQYMILTDRLLDSVSLSGSVEENLNTLLGILCSLAAAHSHYFYILQNNQYALKAVKHPDTDSGDLQSHNDRLSALGDNDYVPPQFLPLEAFPQGVANFTDGSISLLAIPVKGGKGIVHIRLLPEISVQDTDILAIFGEKLEPVLDMILEKDHLEGAASMVPILDREPGKPASIAVDFESMIYKLINVFIGTTEADGGALLKNDEGSIHIPVFVGMDRPVINSFCSDIGFHHRLFDRMGSNKILTLKEDGPDFFQMPPYLVQGGVKLLLLVNVKKDEKIGLVALLYKNIPNMDRYRVTTLMMLAKRMSDIIESHTHFKELSDSYTGVLKSLCQTLDSLNSFSVGASELMSRYTFIICREMRLPEKDTQEIALAAYLSNIGILGLKSDIINSKGKYTRLQYESMKAHPEIGASIIETTLSNKNIASYIRYHHEQIDGHGYPYGLKGTDIPLGARIIAVVQDFLAKIMGRSTREALPFEKALELLAASSGTKLDGTVVEELLRWFKKKQSSALYSGRSLGPCWEMRCSPSGICARCPAYKNTDRNCWEFDGVNCVAHGNRCRSCFIYTEAVHRKGMTLANKDR